MENLTLAFLLDILSKASGTTAIIIILWALLTERIVPKKRLDDCIQHRDNLIKDRDNLRRKNDKLHESLEKVHRHNGIGS